VNKTNRVTLTAALSQWPARRWFAAAAASALAYLVVAVPTDLIDTPFFSREIPPTWWAYPALGITAVLTGLLVARVVVASGHNERVQHCDPIAHGEMSALRAAGRQKSYRDTTLYKGFPPDQGVCRIGRGSFSRPPGPGTGRSTCTAAARRSVMSSSTTQAMNGCEVRAR